ncbi:D-3-phosphoglycerate dehydrogenase [Chitinophaga sp. YR573]|uniref:phosphoglycerate dehydrogenase n=1 Tax=Chitinophaga sp. YR573 TaxID=1881040 RepID=UPI0008AF7442|nr:phosphoglycerate dehydrogenase [Chitinophaga sp. YR573]SEW40870.1 D-3-phosphoglycerate dehydrogenase [Chitinophaga sp. YR573]
MDQQKLTSYPKEKINILLLENISDAAAAEFTSAGYANVKRLSGALNEEDLIREVKDVHLLGIRSKTHVTKKVLEAAQKLQAIGCFCIGTNQVDLKNAMEHGVTVFNAPYSNTRSVAELVIGLSIMLIRRIPDKNAAAHEGKWMKEAKGSYELRGKSLGIVGYGNIGSQLSILAEAMGMNVLYYDIETKLPLGNATQVRTLETLFEQADIISLHVPSTEGTNNMITKDILSHAKHGAIFINYARGEVVDLDALKDVLVSGQLSGAAIDVFPVEPEKNGAAFTSPLQKLPNVILTPHIGGSTEEAQHNIGLDVSSKMLNYLEKGASFGSHTIPAINVPAIDHTHRILHIHENVPGVLSEINTVLSKNKINILGQYLKTSDTIGYVVLDVDTKLSKEAFSLLREVKHTIKARLLY